MNFAAKIKSIESDSSLTTVQKDIQFADMKLKHYNQWLTDESREMGTVYPGFPGDTPVRTVVEKVKEMKAERAVRKATAAKPAKGESKKVAALRIFKEEKGARAKILERFMSELGMSKAGASTYFYNTKALSV